MVQAFQMSLARVVRLLPPAMLVLFWHVATACAHASLTAAEPADGAVVEHAPSRYLLTFSEPASPLALKLVKPDGGSIALDLYQLRDRTVEIEAPSSLSRGTHVLSWRVVSEDGHPIGGSVVFSIGEASVQAPAVENQIDWRVRGGLWLSKLALYVGLFMGVGGVLAKAVLMPRLASGRRFVGAALVIGAGGAILSGGFQGLDALAAPAQNFLDPIVWSAGLTTTYGRTILVSLAAFALAALGLALPRRFDVAAAVAALLTVGVALSLSGHASAAAPQWLMRPAVFLHAVALTVWTGALVPLGLALRRNEGDSKAALRRFSRAIPVFVGVLVATGFALAVVQVQRPAALFDTAYGQVLFVKLMLLVGLFLLAGVNRWSLTESVQSGDESATRRLVRSIAVETVVAIAIFGTAAVWRFTPPPRVLAAQAVEPVTVELQSDKAAVVLWIGPARAGPVNVVANVLAADYGAIEPRQVSITFSKPDAGIEPFKRPLSRGEGMADWHADGVAIPLAGLWQVRVDVLISDFDIARLDGEIRIRP